ncbi:DUF4157 domain-containing protein [Streptomyces sp. NPDC098789]|uniref:eCIS core domain-containing protein n=1 Tax=Streptomyces sp. NPDC098789 TaxID=3366098 RepID=UPI003826407D
MRNLHSRTGLSNGTTAGKPAGGPAAPPLSGAWIQHIQQVQHVQRRVAPSARPGPLEQEPDHAQAQRSALELGITSPVESMEDGLRTEMEQRFGGADFSGVLVHKGAQARKSAALLDAKAYTTGPHIVVGDELSKKEWAHELTHYEDQLAGSVPGTDSGAGVSMSSPDDAGERHAERTAEEVMSGPASVQRTAGADHPEAADKGPSGHPGGGGCPPGDGCGGGRTPAVQRMHVIRANSAEYPQKKPDSDKFFVGQDTNDENSWFDEVSPDAPPKPHLVYQGRVDLAVSDGFDLAVEHAGRGQEPKNFFATDKQLSASIARLPGKDKGAGISLSKTGRTLTLNGPGRKITLYEIEPKYRAKKGGEKLKGAQVHVPQRCNEMIWFVTRIPGVMTGADRPYWDVVERFLVRLDPGGDWGGRYQQAESLGARGGEDKARFFEITRGMSGRFQQLVRDNAERAEEVLRDLGVNEHAPTPDVGEGMTVIANPDATQVASAQSATPYHYGGVVARSGNDYITMENYFREQPEGGLATVSDNDPLWYFRMYGQEEGRTWHEGWTGTGLFVGATITMKLSG